MTAALRSDVAGGWQARLELGFAPVAARTALVHSAHRGPLRVQRPFHPEADGSCHVYLLHPPGGVVGGDGLALDVQLAPGARALLTTPSASRFYRSAGARALQRQLLRVGAGARLDWLPQETIV
ncbi:MAG TPA: urease accessory protein UreD, partial [Plasticicumulans sp.]|nr:urease accessory protein UreD [Plasticicumulans sp.]